MQQIVLSAIQHMPWDARKELRRAPFVAEVSTHVTGNRKWNLLPWWNRGSGVVRAGCRARVVPVWPRGLALATIILAVLEGMYSYWYEYVENLFCRTAAYGTTFCRTVRPRVRVRLG